VKFLRSVHLYPQLAEEKQSRERDMINLTYDKAVSLIREAIAEKGEDYVYEKIDDGCYYVHGGQPSCLVGHVLVRAGVNMDLLEAEGGLYDAHGYADALCGELEREGILTAGRRTIRLLNEVQYNQDRGVSWGAALESGLALAEQP
jgi:hypothetical protein